MICRIGHYDKNYYLSRKIGKELSTIDHKIKRPYGKIWHSFTAWPPFNMIRDRKTVHPSQFFDIFKEDIWCWKTSFTTKPEPWMSDYIKKWGWQMIPEESLSIARRKIKEYPMPLS